MALPSRPAASGAATTRPAALLPLLLLLLLGAVWGGVIPIAKAAAVHGVPPIGYTFWYALGAGLLLSGLAFARGAAPAADRRHLVYYALCGVIGISLPQVNNLYVLRHVPAGAMAVVMTMAPVFTYALALAIGVERFRTVRFAGIACGLAGALALVLPRDGLPGGPATAAWVALGLATPACYAAQNILAARLRPPGSASLALAGGMLLVAAAALLPVGLVTGELFVPGWPLGVAELALLAQLLLTSVAYLLYFELLRLAGPVFVAQVAYVVTATAVGWGVLLFDERHGPWMLVAVLLVFAGVALVNLRRGGGGDRC